MPTFYSLSPLFDGSVNTAKIASNAVTIAKIDSLGADPNADRILFWDDSAGALKFLTAGTGLTIAATTISAGTGAIQQITSGINSMTGSTTEAELDTYSFSAAELGLNDFVFVKIRAECENDGSTAANCTVRVTDGTSTVDIDIDGGTVACLADLTIFNGLSTTSEWKRIIYAKQAYGVGTGDTTDPILSARGTMTVDQWIVGVWTLSLRGSPANAGSTVRVSWVVMKVAQ